jgi:DNA-binding MarR family transcriptional regulator
MTTTSAVTLNPQIVGQAENAHAAILTRALLGTGVTKNQWVPLSLAMATDGTVQPGELADRAAAGLKISRSDAAAVISDLVAAGLLADARGESGPVVVTDDGRALFGRVRGATGQIVGRAYADIPAEDLHVAARVLATITSRLSRELGES